MNLGTPRSEQGQMIERGYGWNGEDFYCRTIDQSSGETTWARAKWPEEIPESYVASGADEAPPVSEWVPCNEPKEEK